MKNLTVFFEWDAKDTNARKIINDAIENLAEYVSGASNEDCKEILYQVLRHKDVPRYVLEDVKEEMKVTR